MVAGFAACWQAAAVACLLAASPALAGQVGYTTVTVPDPPGEPLKVGIWYPAKAPASEQDIGLFTQTVAPNATVEGRAHPLIVMSHGTGGTLEGHYDTALALAHAGFVVAAMTHTGDNYRDQSRATDIADRPRAVHAVIDYMVTGWTEHGSVDPSRVGVFGFSSGGFTVLAAAGGVPDLTRIAPYCTTHAASFVCQLAIQHPSVGKTPIPPEAWIADTRIKAAVVAAPAIGFTFSRAGLSKVRMPIQLWTAEKDHILPAPDYADAVRAALPRPPEFHVVRGADHFDFLAPCSDALAQVAPQICEERGGFDRAAFHRVFNREVVRFFAQTLEDRLAKP
jgi:predicted dienelactone hydrolase